MGQRFELTCTLGTDPGTDISSITWTTPTNMTNSTSTMDSLVLTIDPVTSGDAGTYTCSITYNTSTLIKSYELTPIQLQGQDNYAERPQSII